MTASEAATRIGAYVEQSLNFSFSNSNVLIECERKDASLWVVRVYKFEPKAPHYRGEYLYSAASERFDFVVDYIDVVVDHYNEKVANGRSF